MMVRRRHGIVGGQMPSVGMYVGCRLGTNNGHPVKEVNRQ